MPCQEDDNDGDDDDLDDVVVEKIQFLILRMMVLSADTTPWSNKDWETIIVAFTDDQQHKQCFLPCLRMVNSHLLLLVILRLL